MNDLDLAHRLSRRRFSEAANPDGVEFDCEDVGSSTSQRDRQGACTGANVDDELVALDADLGDESVC